ncbi:hypothetical protein QR46_4944 [Giardia duodenalis assemblage B]|uniref:Uncharacterized protein n=1 Tax=Giardia duodenalis assemblage B TaxID=1394984 RepID=A0A132NMT8_GIAIN|nr:hypothetical protein QR46_4944 [Giardia intestinalis assemblage B]
MPLLHSVQTSLSSAGLSHALQSGVVNCGVVFWVHPVPAASGTYPLLHTQTPLFSLEFAGHVSMQPFLFGCTFFPLHREHVTRGAPAFVGEAVAVHWAQSAIPLLAASSHLMHLLPLSGSSLAAYPEPHAEALSTHCVLLSVTLRYLPPPRLVHLAVPPLAFVSADPSHASQFSTPLYVLSVSVNPVVFEHDTTESLSLALRGLRKYPGAASVQTPLPSESKHKL